MKIDYIEGDFIDGAEDCIVHGCNAQGVMGRGAALAVKHRLAFAYEAYRTEHLRWKLRLGTVVWAFRTGHAERPRIVGNCITQVHYDAAHRVNGMNVDYDAVRSCFREINTLVQKTQDWTINVQQFEPITRVGTVKIGAGLGGGDWEIIAKIIEHESKDFTPIVYVL